MVKHIDNKVVYYYDSHPTEEDLMGETAIHAALIHYLVDMLRWLLRDRVCAVHENLNFYVTTDYREKPLVPDIAVIKGIDYQYIRSLSIGLDDPAPQVVFEIASKETWEKDFSEKPMCYAQMGMSEYIFYDPNMPLLHQSTSQRLFIWQLNKTRSSVRPLQANANGQIWSEQLESWLAPDGYFLRLYDRFGNLRLTQAEAEAQRAEEEALRAGREASRATREAERAALLAEKLRSLGIDPDAV